MTTRTTLRQTFDLGIAIVLVAFLAGLSGSWLIGKAARLHHLERQHLSLVTDAELALREASTDAGRTAVPVARLRDAVDRASALSRSLDEELRAPERLALRLLGHGRLVELPTANEADLARLRRTLPDEPGAGLDSTLASLAEEPLAAVGRNSDDIAEHLIEAVSQLSLIVLWVDLAGAAALLFALALLRRRVLGPLSEALGFANRIARGDLSVRDRPTRDDEFGRLMGALTGMQASLGHMVTNVCASSTRIADIGTGFADGNVEINERMARQSGALERTASAMKTLGASARQNSDRAAEVNELALGASTLAVEGGEIVSGAIETMKGISAASREISDIIAVIDDIAFQTNILALNAAVEAARAGEQGRGFAVVASEVRSLAGRSAEAARRINALTETSVQRVAHGEEMVGRAGTSMNGVVGAITRVTELIGGISAASDAQRAGVANASEVFASMDEATRENARLVDGIVTAAAGLEGQTRELTEAVTVFKLIDETAPGAIEPYPKARSDSRCPERRSASASARVR